MRRKIGAGHDASTAALQGMYSPNITAVIMMSLETEAAARRPFSALSAASEGFAGREPNISALIVMANSGLIADALEHLPVGFAIFQADLTMSYCNRALVDMLDLPDAMFRSGMPTMEQLLRHNVGEGEYGGDFSGDVTPTKKELVRSLQSLSHHLPGANGRIVEVRCAQLESGGFVSIYLDVSAVRARGNARLQVDFGDLDKLTGLPTLKSAQIYLGELLQNEAANGKICVTCLGINGFAELNRQHGRVISDYALKELANRLSGALRGSDSLFRIGSDRFLIIHPTISKPSEPAKIAGRLMDEIRRVIVCGDRRLELSAAVAIKLVDNNNSSANSILTGVERKLEQDRRARKILDYSDMSNPVDPALSESPAQTEQAA
jgi:diguanylate cyclase (GGDEF)-like protein